MGPSDGKIRVMFFLPYPFRMAGANRMMHELISRLPECIAPVVVVTEDGTVAEEFRRSKVELLVVRPGASLNQFGKAMLLWSFPKRAWVGLRELLPYTVGLYSIITRKKFDIVHISEPRGLLLAGCAAWLSGRRIITHIHGEIPFGGFIPKLVGTLSDCVITCTGLIQASLPEKAQRKAITIHYGVGDIPLCGPPSADLEVLRSRGVLIVCCFASVVPFKGHRHLLDATATLNQRGWRERLRVLCVGDLPREYARYQEWLLRRKRELNVDNVEFTGWQQDPFPFYRAADICVLPSVKSDRLELDGTVLDVQGNEGLPRTHLEAMYFGKPILGTDVAGVREQVVHGVNGFVVPPGEPHALADAMEVLLSDQDLRQRMGLSGRQRVLEHFDLNSYVQNTMKVYRQVLQT